MTTRSLRPAGLAIALLSTACVVQQQPPADEPLSLEVRFTSKGGFNHINPLLNTGHGEGWTVEVAPYRGQWSVALAPGERVFLRLAGSERSLDFSDCSARFLGHCLNELTYRTFLDEVGEQTPAEVVFERDGAVIAEVAVPLLPDFSLLAPTWGATMSRGQDELAVKWSTDGPAQATEALGIEVDSRCLAPISATVGYADGERVIPGSMVVLAGPEPEDGDCVGDLVLSRRVGLPFNGDGFAGEIAVSQERSVSISTWP